MCAVPSKVIFCSSLMLIWPGILPTYVSSPFLIVPSAPMITGIVSVLMPHIRFVSIFKSLYLDRFSVTFTDVFLSDGTAMSISLQVYYYYYYCEMVSGKRPLPRKNSNNLKVSVSPMGLGAWYLAAKQILDRKHHRLIIQIVLFSL